MPPPSELPPVVGRNASGASDQGLNGVDAAYIAYQRSSNSTEEAESLVVIARTYAPHAMASGARCTARFARDARGR